jgi:hypothetical protein
VYDDLANRKIRHCSKDPYHGNCVESITYTMPEPRSPLHHAHQPKAVDSHGSSAPPRRHEPCAHLLPLRTSNSTNQSPPPLPQAETYSRCNASKEGMMAMAPPSHVQRWTRFSPRNPRARRTWCPAMVPPAGRNDAQGRHHHRHRLRQWRLSPDSTPYMSHVLNNASSSLPPPRHRLY